MIINNEKRNLKTKGLKETGAFTISATQHMFRILSDGLYSDKIKAVVRELTCNGMDSHVAAKHQRQIYVHLPTMIEPEFYVRDYGTGLSHDNVMNLYTTYGESNKNDSNEQIGGLGLGSKSPFAYSDQFTVQSYYGGEERTYSCYVDEEGEPQISMLTCVDSTEPNGLCVKLSVKNEDFGRFKERATELFKYYIITPETNITINTDSPTYTFGLDGLYGIKESNNSYNPRYNNNHSMAKIIQGGVAYPVEYDKMKDLTENEKSLLQTPIDIFMDIGSVEVTASREALSFNKHTIASIKGVIGRILKDLPTHANDAIKDCKTKWDAWNKGYEVSKTFSHHGLNSLVASNLTWGGKKLVAEGIPIVTKDQHKHLIKQGYQSDPYKGSFIVDLRIRKIEANKSLNANLIFKSEDTYLFQPANTSSHYNDPYLILFNDEDKRVPSRVAHYVSTRTKIVLFEGERKEFNKLIKFLGYPPFKVVSELPFPPTKTRDASSGKANLKSLNKNNMGNSWNKWNWFDDIEQPWNDGGIYIKIFAGDIKEDVLTWTKTKEMWDIIERLEGSKIEVLGIPGTYHTKLTNDKTHKYIHLQDHYKKVVDKHTKTLDKQEISEYITTKRFLSSLSSNFTTLLDNKPKINNFNYEKLLHYKSELGRLHKKLSKYDDLFRSQSIDDNLFKKMETYKERLTNQSVIFKNLIDSREPLDWSDKKVEEELNKLIGEKK